MVKAYRIALVALAVATIFAIIFIGVQVVIESFVQY